MDFEPTTLISRMIFAAAAFDTRGGERKFAALNSDNCHEGLAGPEPWRYSLV